LVDQKYFCHSTVVNQDAEKWQQCDKIVGVPVVTGINPYQSNFFLLIFLLAQCHVCSSVTADCLHVHYKKKDTHINCMVSGMRINWAQYEPGPQNIFRQIIRKESPASIVFEDENVLAFHDIRPQAPVHIIIIPKKPIEQLEHVAPEDVLLLGKLLNVARKIAEQLNLSDYRIVINNGPDGCQTVYHLHLHLLGGRSLRWPMEPREV